MRLAELQLEADALAAEKGHALEWRDVSGHMHYKRKHGHCKHAGCEAWVAVHDQPEFIEHHKPMRGSAMTYACPFVLWDEIRKLRK